MNNYVLSCCSTADLSEEQFKERNIPFVCFHFLMDGKEYADDLGKSMPFEVFYKKIEEGAEPTTSQVNVTQFREFFEPYLKEGKDILHVTLSSGISGVYNSACIAAEELSEEYPGRKIYIVDSLGASGGYGLLMDMAADKRDEGLGIDELRDWVEENKLNIHHWFFSTDLTSYFRGGRISRMSHLFGTALNICPLLNMNDKGELIPREKHRGKKKVIKAIVEKMEEFAENGCDYDKKCFMTNSACYDDAKQVADMVEEKFPKLKGKVVINSIGTVIGSHTGPGTVALFFYGSKRTD